MSARVAAALSTAGAARASHGLRRRPDRALRVAGCLPAGLAGRRFERRVRRHRDRAGALRQARPARPDRLRRRSGAAGGRATAAVAARAPARGRARSNRKSARARSPRMLQSFQLNLAALSYIALLVGMYLIYNTVAISVVQRRPEIGTLRALGATARPNLSHVSRRGRALRRGRIGSSGSRSAARWRRSRSRAVSHTVDTLYVASHADRVVYDPLVLLKAFLIGVAAAIVAAIVPALEAAATPPAIAMRAHGYERRLPHFALRAALAGVLLLARRLRVHGGTADRRRSGVRLRRRPAVHLRRIVVRAARHRRTLAFCRASARLAVRRRRDRRVEPRRVADPQQRRRGIADDRDRHDRRGRDPHRLVPHHRRRVGRRHAQGRSVRAADGPGRRVVRRHASRPAWRPRSRAFPASPRSTCFAGLEIPFRGRITTLGATNSRRARRAQQLRFSAAPTRARSRARSRARRRVLISEPFATKFAMGRATVRARHAVGARSLHGGGGLQRLLQRRRHHPDGHCDLPAALSRRLGQLDRVYAQSRRRPRRRCAAAIVRSVLPLRIDAETTRELRTLVIAIFNRTFAITYALYVISITIAVLGVVSTLFALVLERRREIGLVALPWACDARRAAHGVVRGGLHRVARRALRGRRRRDARLVAHLRHQPAGVWVAHRVAHAVRLSPRSDRAWSSSRRWSPGSIRLGWRLGFGRRKRCGPNEVIAWIVAELAGAACTRRARAARRAPSCARSRYRSGSLSPLLASLSPRSARAAA